MFPPPGGGKRKSPLFFRLIVISLDPRLAS